MSLVQPGWHQNAPQIYQLKEAQQGSESNIEFQVFCPWALIFALHKYNYNAIRHEGITRGT